MDKILIGICTHYRNETLKICLEKIKEMDLPQRTIIEVIITDDTKEMHGIKILANHSYPFKIHFNSAHTTGIAAARNSLLKKCLETDSNFIAFIDDDEFPDKNWIKNFYEYTKKTNADILAGPVISTFVDTNLKEKKVQDFIKKNKLFNLHQKRKTGDICSTCATSNVFLKTEILKNTKIQFDETFKKMSGEDIDFFEKLTKAGYKIHWVKEAPVYEHVPTNRCTLKYILKRNFNNGYLRIFMKKRKNSAILKTHINTILNVFFSIFLLPFSVFGGKTLFIKNLGFCAFNLGALNSTFSNKAFHFYD